MRPASLALALAVLASAATTATAKLDTDATAVKVRYIVTDVDAAVAFYTRDLGFQLEAQTGRDFALLSLGKLQLVLSPPVGPGSAFQPASDGRRPEPGGWNRIILETHDLVGETERLRRVGARFRSDARTGPGGRQIVLEDPSGNAVKIFQPAGN